MQLDVVVSPPASEFDYCMHVVFIGPMKALFWHATYFFSSDFFSSGLFSVTFFFLVRQTDRGKATHKSPQCMGTGGLKKWKHWFYHLVGPTKERSVEGGGGIWTWVFKKLKPLPPLRRTKNYNPAALHPRLGDWKRAQLLTHCLLLKRAQMLNFLYIKWACSQCS